jgi:hypothetical protein
VDDHLDSRASKGVGEAASRIGIGEVDGMELDAVRKFRRAFQIEAEHAVSGMRIDEALDEAAPDGRPETGDADGGGIAHGIHPEVAAVAAVLGIR